MRFPFFDAQVVICHPYLPDSVFESGLLFAVFSITQNEKDRGVAGVFFFEEL